MKITAAEKKMVLERRKVESDSNPYDLFDDYPKLKEATKELNKLKVDLGKAIKPFSKRVQKLLEKHGESGILDSDAGIETVIEGVKDMLTDMYVSLQ